MPGSLVSSLIRFARGGAVIVVGDRLSVVRELTTDNRRPSEESRNFHPSRHGPELILHGLVHFARSLVDRGDDEVLQHLHVVWIDGVLLDGHAEAVLLACHRGLAHASAGAG